MSRIIKALNIACNLTILDINRKEVALKHLYESLAAAYSRPNGPSWSYTEDLHKQFELKHQLTAMREQKELLSFLIDVAKEEA